MSATKLDAGTLLSAAADAAPGPGWWDVTSGLLLALAGLYATWAQFVYPKIVERRAKSRPAGDQPAPTMQAPTVDPVVLMIRDQQQLIDDLRDELAAGHRQARRDAGTIARLTAELAATRRNATPRNREADP